MKRVNALQVRQSLGRILDRVVEDEESILVEKGHKPMAVLVPLRLFYERFADKTVHDERLALDGWIRERQKVRPLPGPPADVLLRELRGSLP